ncbi:MAG: DNA polymerase III subunit epsilon [Proteobacteria bacterium]|nr:DNA polymerase III subunit epsilon [Pseudomonadota bacterium]
MREIVLDTETTGLNPAQGHRIIEIYCLELDNHLPTDRAFHALIHPERDIPEESTRVHGMTLEKLAGAPLFADVAAEFLSFIADSPLVIHNAEFDLKFLNAELKNVNLAPLDFSRAIDTIAIAKRRFPGARYSLDELCRRFNIDTSARAKHGAKIDTELLAQVYLELIGGRQARFALAPGDGAPGEASLTPTRAPRTRPKPLPERLNTAEREAHARFVTTELEGDVVWHPRPPSARRGG